MKKVFCFATFLLVIFTFNNCKPTKKHGIEKEKIEDAIKDTKSNGYFKIIGTEPFWNIEISEEKIVYTLMDESKIEFPYNTPVIDKSKDTRTYKSVNGNGSIEIKLTKGFCTDGMSDRDYNFKAEVEVIKFKKVNKLKGCGFFVADDFFSGKWFLKLLKSKKVATDENSIIPFIEFDIENKVASGNAGCNGFNSSFVLNEDKILFREILLTRMFCDDSSLEKIFEKSLNEVNSFRVEGNELKFYKDGFLEMVFEKK